MGLNRSASDSIIHYQSIINMNTSSENPTSTHKELIIQAIQSSMDSLHIYCFSYLVWSQRASNTLICRLENTVLHHYYLFVINETHKEEFVKMQDDVNSKLPEYIQVTLVCESRDALREKANYNNSFYQTILNSSEKWVTSDEYPVDMATCEIKQLIVYQKEQRFWKIRYDNANGLLMAASQGGGCGYDEAIAVMLSLSLEQICLGLIQISLRYFPSTNDIIYLMDLVSCITPIAEEVFCLNVSDERKIIKNLSDSMQQFRSLTNYEVDEYNLYLICDRTEIFLQKADQFVQAYLESLN